MSGGKQIVFKHLIGSIVLNSFLYAILLLCTLPVYQTGDDLNIMLHLAGGYDGQPTLCLPFYYNAHYFINTPLSLLYRHFPGTNWYGVWLLTLQHFAGIAICFVLLQRHRLRTALIIYGFLFLVFGATMFLYLNQSSTSTACTLGALLLVWESIAEKRIRWGCLLAGVLLLVAGALVRLHTLLPVIVVAAPFILLVRGRRRQMIAGASIVGSLAIAWLLYQQQHQHYAKNCPGWVQEEQYRQAKYANINYHKDQQALAHTPYVLEAAMLRELLLFDTSFPDKTTLYKLAQTTNAPASIHEVLSKDTWYWDFINHRLLLASVILVLIVCYAHRAMPAVAWLSLLAALATIFYMQVYRKMPAFFIPGVLMTFTAFALYRLPYRGFQQSVKRIVWTLALVAIGSWALVRIVKTSQHNREQFQYLLEGYQELAIHPDKLFIQTNQEGRYSSFYSLADPSKYRFGNILFLDHPLSTARADAIRTALGVADIRQAPLYSHVYFAGRPSTTLLQYYQRVLGKSLQYSDPLPGFKTVEVRQLIVQP